MDARTRPTVVLIPVYNDWDAVVCLLSELNQQLAEPVDVLLVDDGSLAPMPAWPEFGNFRTVKVLHLRRNLGHQRAIAIGLFEAADRMRGSAVIVMDGDGEDRPDHVPLLLEEFRRRGSKDVIFAARTKRLESLWFRVFYALYRRLHLLFTGIEVRVGNFSVLPPEAVSRLMVVPELWNHYAAAVFRAKLPLQLVPLPRGRRLRGQSTMNFVSLVIHGLSAISVFSDVVSARLLVAASGFSVALTVALGVVVAVRFGTGLAIPGWATYAGGILAVLLLQSLLLAVLLVFQIIGSRTQMSFLAARDAHYFIAGRTVAWAAPATQVAMLAQAVEMERARSRP
ncbi:MAG: glycosyltransferase [Bryobacteraceae bacterium]|nr:glycosyltransferase [Bryobacteraceae bacterium]